MSMTSMNDYAQFAREITSLVPIRLDDYKQRQMERRIRDLARKHQAEDLMVFMGMLRADPKLRREFEQHITINVSEFYRNPQAFDYLVERVLPILLAGGRGLRIWSAGCSYGAEPYTMAMLLQQLAPALRHGILATDIDRDMLAKARLGKGFTPLDIANLPLRLRDTYMVPEGQSYGVSAKLAPLLRFERHDLLRDTMNQTFDLIACRNVVIYFTDEAKARLYQTFAQALRPGGYLFIGGTETINKACTFGLTYVAPCFYSKSDT